MGGRIDLYIDIASLYSYIAFVQVVQNHDILKQHNVEVDIHPVLLGAINAGSGNQPPWVLPAKRAHSAHDSRRSLRAAGLHSVSPPGDLFLAGRTQVPLRALHHIKRHSARGVYVCAWRALFHAFWTAHRPPNDGEALAAALSAGVGEDGDGSLFAPEEVARIVQAAAEPAYKDALRDATQMALDRGAFGAPWLWVTDSATGKAEPFFGSDRWHHVYEFLGLPYQDVALLSPGERGPKSKI
ncbi:thioredoxin-like protein [Jackrogersella minutella]|nr:thioredoxin-like protein [Jackrogersella minutella]